MNKNEAVFQEMMLAVKNGLESGKLDLERDMPDFKEEVIDEITSRLSRSIEIDVKASALAELRQDISEAEKHSKDSLEKVQQEKKNLALLNLEVQQKTRELQKKLKEQEDKMQKIKPTWWVSFTGYIVCSLSAIILAILTFCFLWHLIIGQVWAWFDPMHLEWSSVFKLVGFLIVTIIIHLIGCVFVSTPMLVWDKIQDMRGL